MDTEGPCAENLSSKLGVSLVRPDLLVPEDHPIRTIEMLADAELRRLSPVVDQMYSRMGRPSIPPEYLLPPP